MIRVLIDGVIYGQQSFGGISRCFTEILARLGHQYDDIEVILHVPRHCRVMLPKAKWIREIRDCNLRPYRIFRGVSKSWVRSLRPQIFHSTYYTSPYWQELKRVVTVHDFIHERYTSLTGDARLFINQKRREIEEADAIVAVSHSTRNDILTYTRADQSRITVIHHGVSNSFLVTSGIDRHTFRESHKIGDPYWLYVGNRGLYKNFGTLLRAFVQVAPQTDGYLVAIGGENKLEPWQVDLLIRYRLEQRVCLLHATDDEALRLAYLGSAAFVFPSLAEGFGIPLLEAMACGAPVVAADIPVFREIATDSALYFDPYDEEALAYKMIQVLDENMRHRLVERGLKRVKEFSWDSAACKLVDVYKSLV